MQEFDLETRLTNLQLQICGSIKGFPFNQIRETQIKQHRIERRAFNRSVRQHSKSISAIKLDDFFSRDFRNRQLPFETRLRKRRQQRRQSIVNRAFDTCAPHWLAAYAEAGVPNGVRMFYSVRHAYATDMANKGMELPDCLAKSMEEKVCKQLDISPTLERKRARYTVEDVRQLCGGISRSTVMREIRRKRLACYRPRRTLRFSEEHITKYLESVEQTVK